MFGMKQYPFWKNILSSKALNYVLKVLFHIQYPALSQRQPGTEKKWETLHKNWLHPIESTNWPRDYRCWNYLIPNIKEHCLLSLKKIKTSVKISAGNKFLLSVTTEFLKNHIELLQLKNTITEIKSTIDWLKRKLDTAEDRMSGLPEWSPTILLPGTHFVEAKFSMDWRRVGWFQDDSRALHLLCTSLFLHQLHLRSLGIRSQRLGTTELYDMQEDIILSLIQHGRHMDRKYRIRVETEDKYRDLRYI